MAKVHGFTPDGARRVAQATRTVETLVRGTAPGRGRWPVIAAAGAGSLILTTSAISPRSGTTVGSGSANLVTLSGSTLTAGSAITLKNVSAVAGATGKYGIATNIGGTWFLVSLECS